MFEIDNAKLFLEELNKHFAKKEKVKISTLLGSLVSMKYNNGNIIEYIIEMSHLVSKLETLKLTLDIIMHLVLISLLTQFNQFKDNYNCQKEKWTLNEFISHCI